MAYRVISPENSFVQFGETSAIASCNFPDITLCLPVYLSDDVSFQFVVEADDETEAQFLCGLTNDQITLGIAESCDQDTLLDFSQKPDRYRISPRQVLYNWQYGVPGFNTVVPIGGCFFIKVMITGGTEACSNCFQRIASDCHTSVLEYGNDDNAFGFNYCSASAIDPEVDTCEPTFVTFAAQSTLSIPYTAALQTKYGLVPTVKTWIYDTNGDLVNMGITETMNGYPPTQLNFDFGGPASGVIKIS